MGRVINKTNISNKTSQMNTKLTSLQDVVLKCRSNFDMIISQNTKLSGTAWSQYTGYLQEVQKPILDAFDTWLKEAIEDNNTYASEASKISENILDEDKINRAIKRNEDEIDREYSKFIPNIFVIMYCEYQIKKLQKKIKEIDTFEGNTQGLFKEVETALKALEKLRIKCGQTAFNKFAFTFTYTPVDQTWIKELQQIHSKRVLEDADMTQDQLTAIVSKGIYSEAEIVRGLESCVTEQDIQFYKNLLTGEYLEAFETDPNRLSEAITVIMADHANRLYMLDDKDALKSFNDAIFASSKIYVEEHVFEDNPDAKELIQTDKIYRDIYLERLYTGSKLIEITALANTALMDPKSAGYTSMLQRCKDINAMSNLWATEMAYINKLRSQIPEYATLSTITDISWDRDLGNVSVTINHYSYQDAGYIDREIGISLLEDSNELSNYYSMQETVRIQQQLDNMLSNMVMDMGSTFTLLVLGTVAPEIVLPASFGVAAMNSSFSKITGADAYFEGPNAKLGAKSGVMATAKIADFLSAYGSGLQQLDASNLKAKMQWFGSGTLYSYDLNQDKEIDASEMHATNIGIRDPAVLRTMNQWNEEGIASVMGWSDKERKALLAKFKEGTLEHHILDDSYNVLNDSYINSNHEEVHVDFLEFQTAVTKIDIAIDGSGLQTLFNEKVKENR